MRLRLVRSDLRVVSALGFPETVARLRGQEEAYEAAIREVKGEEEAERVAGGPLGVGQLRLGVMPAAGTVSRGCRED